MEVDPEAECAPEPEPEVELLRGFVKANSGLMIGFDIGHAWLSTTG